MNKNTPKLPLKIEVKTVKHRFSPDELVTLGGDLARALADGSNLESEFDQVKQEYKAKLAEVESRTQRIGTAMLNKFDMRQERCVVVFHPEKREKHFFLEQEWQQFDKGMQEGKSDITIAPALTEPMTLEDFQQELIQAESIFEHRKELELFKPAGNDKGALIVGHLAGRWFSALRVTIGNLKLEERLDSEQKGFKDRFGAIEQATIRYSEWLSTYLKDHAKGFVDSMQTVLTDNRELAQ